MRPVRSVSSAAILLLLASCAEHEPTAPQHLVATQSATSAQVEDLLTVVDESAVALSAQQERVVSIRGRPQSEDVYIARLASGADNILRRGGNVAITLSAMQQFILSPEQVDVYDRQRLDWLGTLADGMGVLSLSLVDGSLYGTLEVGPEIYLIEPIGGDLYAIARLAPSGFPREVPPARDGENSTNRSDALLVPALLSGTDTIDIMVAYTSAAASAAGSISALIQQAIAATNQAYDNSDVAVRVALAHTEAVSYSEVGKTWSNHIDYLTDPTDGQLDELHVLRYDHRADVVVLLVAGPGGYCGVAETIAADVKSAFAVVKTSCAVGNRSFAHEVGHLQGADHDAANDCNCGPWAFGLGYIAPSWQFRTIMAYDECSGCPRINNFSNPDITYSGQATGTAGHDNARVLDMTRVGMSMFGDKSFYARLLGADLCVNSCPYTISDIVGAELQNITFSWNVYYHGTGEYVPLPGTSASETITTNAQRQNFTVTAYLSTPSGYTYVTKDVCYTLMQC